MRTSRGGPLVEAAAEDETEEECQRRDEDDGADGDAGRCVAMRTARSAAASSTVRPGRSSGRCASAQPTTTAATAAEAP